MSKERYTPEQVIAAVRETKGMVYLAAKRLGCSAQTVYNYRDRYDKVREAIEEETNVVDDVAELKLYDAIKAGEGWAIRFRLEQKARHRGYGNQVNVRHQGHDGGPVRVSLEEALQSIPDVDLDDEVDDDKIWAQVADEVEGDQ